MNKTYILFAAFAVSAGVSLASSPKYKKNEVPLPLKHCSEFGAFENMILEQQQSTIVQTQGLGASDRDPAQEQSKRNFYNETYSSRLGKLDLDKNEMYRSRLMKLDLDKKTCNMKDEEETSSKGITRNDDTETIEKGTTRNDDAVRAVQNGITSFTHNVREALPSLLFSVVMGAFTMNEMNDRDGPDASIIPLSSMALLGGIQTFQILRYGKNSAYSIVPQTVKEAIRKGLSFIPGMTYLEYRQFTDHSIPFTKNANVECAIECAKKCLQPGFPEFCNIQKMTFTASCHV